MRLRLISRLLSLTTLLLGTASWCQPAADASWSPENVRGAMRPLSCEGVITYPESIQEYFRYYNLKSPHEARHYFGSLHYQGIGVAVHVFKPKQPSRGTVLLVHGYYDHAGILTNLVHHLVRSRYTVVVYDQPGHGLSGGKRASIASFNDYTAVFKEMVYYCQANFTAPLHVIAHSMGCAVVTDYLLRFRQSPFCRLVFLAPLYRSAHWVLSGIGHKLGGSMAESFPRVFRDNSSDKEFCRFLENDPLQTRHIPSRWVTAHRQWVDKVTGAAPYPALPIMIIQGNKDSIVDWKRNLNFFQETFPGSDVRLVPEAQHQLLNESPILLNRVLDQLSSHLKISCPK